MNVFLFDHVCKMYNVGKLVASPTQIFGGWMHEVWQLHTSEGMFAVKLLDPYLVALPGFLTATHRGDDLAQYMKMQGVPTVPAIRLNNSSTALVQDRQVMLFEWIIGECLDVNAALPDRAKQIGWWLGKMHVLAHHFYDKDKKVSEDFENVFMPPKKDWQSLFQQADALQFSWLTEIKRLFEQINRWDVAAKQASILLKKDTLLCHRDLGQTNVIWSSPTAPFIIDWGYVGYIYPGVELLGTALNWAGMLTCRLDESTFKALIKAYQVAVGFLPRLDQVVADAFIGFCLDWVVYNMQRSIDQGQENKLITHMIMKTLNSLLFLNGEMQKVFVELKGD